MADDSELLSEPVWVTTTLGCLPFVHIRCCRVWLIVSPAIYPTGRCGLCGSNDFTRCTQDEADQYEREREER